MCVNLAVPCVALTVCVSFRLFYWNHGIELEAEYILTTHLASPLTWVHLGKLFTVYAQVLFGRL